MQHVVVLASFICFFLTCVDEVCATCPKRTPLNTNRTMNRKMLHHAFKVIPVVLSPYQCADACLRDARCKSFNYKRNVNECELNDSNWYDAKSWDVVQETGSDLYDVDFERLHEVSSLHKEVLPFLSLKKSLKCGHSNESY